MKSAFTLFVISAFLLGSCASLSTNSSIQKRKYNKGFFVSKKASKKIARSITKETSPTFTAIESNKSNLTSTASILKQPVAPIIKTIEHTPILEVSPAPSSENEHAVQPTQKSKLQHSASLEKSISIESSKFTEEVVEPQRNKPENLGRSITLIVIGGLKILLAGILLLLALYVGSIFLLVLAGFHFLTGATLFTIGNVSMFRSIKKVKNNSNSES